MNNALLSFLDNVLDKPAWRRALMLALFSVCFGAVLYFLFLSSLVRQQQERLQKNADLQHKTLLQQKTLIRQPALSALLLQQSLLAGHQEGSTILLEQLKEPLSQSKSTLVKWQPTVSESSTLIKLPTVEKGHLTVNADFNSLFTLMRQLVNSPSTPTLSLLSLQTGNALVDARFVLTAEVLKPTRLMAVSAFEGSVRDPFLPALKALCPDLTQRFKGVVLGGVMGNTERLHGWLMWPGEGWKKASPGWRDSASGWRVDVVERGRIVFDLDRPSCVRQTFKIQMQGQ